MRSRTGYARVEAGAQGQHKIARGYEPVPTWSAHWIPNDSFRSAINNYLEAERAQTGMEIEAQCGTICRLGKTLIKDDPR